MRAMIAAGAGLLAAAVAPAEAASIFSNGAVAASDPRDVTNSTVADDVTLGSDATVNRAGVWLMDYSTSGIGNWEADGRPLDWFLYADGTAGPGAALASGSALDVTVSPTGVMGAREIHKAEFSLGEDLLLAGGTTYWFGIHADDGFATGDFVFWMNAATGSGAAAYTATGTTDGPWVSVGTQRAFELAYAEAIPAVPLPAALPLLAGGLAGLLALRRRG